MKTFELDGVVRRYNETTNWQVMLRAPGATGFKTEYNITSGPTRAVLWYNGINIGRGYAKKLVQVDGRKRTVLAEDTSLSW